MNPYDVALLIAVGVAALAGAVKGFVRIVLGLAALVAAFLAASWFDGVVGSLFSCWIASDSLRRLLGFAIVFLGVLVAGGIAVWLVGMLLSAAHVRWVDRLAGAALGAAGAILLFAAVTVPVVAYLPEDAGLLQNSRFAPWVVTVGRRVDAAVPAGVRERFRERIARLEQRWQDATHDRPAPADSKRR